MKGTLMQGRILRAVDRHRPPMVRQQACKHWLRWPIGGGQATHSVIIFFLPQSQTTSQYQYCAIITLHPVAARKENDGSQEGMAWWSLSS